MDHGDVRYLAAKRSVDDRALSSRVRDRFLEALPSAPRILEAGCGTGVTVPRLRSWGVTAGTYRGVDRNESVVARARQARAAELAADGAAVRRTERGFEVGEFAAAFEVGDALPAFGAETDADAVLAQGFLDLVPLADALAAFEAALAPGGLLYLPITFDGGTIFQPDHPADRAVERAYHRAIDARPGRDSHAGRHAADRLRTRDGDLLGMAASDWVVRPRDGNYPGAERQFLARILEFVEAALADDEGTAASVGTGDAVAEFPDWLATRRRQLAAGELTYVAHQYDLLYRTPGA
ncbi:MAG: methyltransferase domain-containing protein [Halobacteriales archaeon]